jgi:hypothetical protein
MPVLSVLLFAVHFTNAQSTYFQQHVGYTIDVELDDQQHMLRGFEKIVYTNNSPDTLQYLIMHVWPNAYKNDRSRYTEQDVENGNTNFYYSTADQRGSIDSLKFRINDQAVQISQYNNEEDIIRIDLNEPLLPGKKIQITTPFRVKIPHLFSRLGHKEQSYQISQWYPKPAVYDRYGWHPMPYLDQGEFYSEFGDFTVRINIPSNYVVAATGELQEANEKTFIAGLAQLPDSIKRIVRPVIASDSVRKTITYVQSNVHDFAWFADKRFSIEHQAITESGQTIHCYSYYLPQHHQLYKGSTEMIAKTISHLSARVGLYPYMHASVVDGELMAGGGMEYPMVTVIGPVTSVATLQTVITHEVGHNWFYGILGSNERDHPWMDESINTFYENQITSLLDTTHKRTLKSRVFANQNASLLYYLMARQRLDQPLSTTSDAFTSTNYAGILYQKGPMLFWYLQDYLGQTVFDSIMHTYFQAWKFKHPYPEDFRAIATAISPKPIDWFFDEAIASNQQIDFKIKKATLNKNQASFLVHSKTNFRGPIPISAIAGDSIVETIWTNYPYENPATFQGNQQAITRYMIDPTFHIPDMNGANNIIYNRKFGKRLKPGLGLVTRINPMISKTFYVLPAYGFNVHDKLMLGAVIHRIEIPNRKFQFALAPMYSFGSKQIVGSGFASYSIFPKTTLQQITFYIGGRSYHHNESQLNIPSSLYTRHIKVAPGVHINFKQSYPRSTVKNRLDVRYAVVAEQGFNYAQDITDSLFKPSVSKYITSTFANVMFEHRNDRTFHPYAMRIDMQGNGNFLKTGIEGTLRIDYERQQKSMYLRVFGGHFAKLNNDANPFQLRNQFLNTTSTARNDFQYDEVWMARNEQTGWMTQQISMREGGFKIPTLFLSNPIGQSDKWLTAFNIAADIPIKLPLKFRLFFDAATFANAKKLNNSTNRLLYDGGIQLHLFKDLLVIYAPLLMSKDFKQYTQSTFPENRFLRTLSFSLNTNRINWSKTQDALRFFM